MKTVSAHCFGTMILILLPPGNICSWKDFNFLNATQTVERIFRKPSDDTELIASFSCAGASWIMRQSEH